MQYLHRSLERKFLHMNSFFKAILVTGARQVGKTTMLRHLAEGTGRTYVSMDNILVRTLAQTDPVLFFQTYQPPMIIDEVQKAPQLFEQIKIMCDESDATGLFWLTGSQQYNMMQNVRESLAGRIGILQLYSLSRNEVEGINFTNEQNYSLPCLLERQKQVTKNNITATYEFIWKGGMPKVLHVDEEIRAEYYNSYIETYLLRDAMETGNISDLAKFRKFILACAALVAEQVNYKTLADAADISQPTAKNWLQLLEGLSIIYMLQPFANNALKRLAKTPKLYFCDTGLAAYLSMWLTRDTLMNGAASGHFFENYVIMETIKNFAYSSHKANFTYYRDSSAKEIDLLVEENNLIHPLEIKKSATPDRREVKKFDVIEKTALEQGAGGILCMAEEVIPIDAHNAFIPCNLI